MKPLVKPKRKPKGTNWRILRWNRKNYQHNAQVHKSQNWVDMQRYSISSQTRHLPRWIKLVKCLFNHHLIWYYLKCIVSRWCQGEGSPLKKSCRGWTIMSRCWSCQEIHRFFGTKQCIWGENVNTSHPHYKVCGQTSKCKFILI